MSHHNRKITTIAFLIGLFLGGLIVFVFKFSENIEQFFSILENVSLSFAALFTTFWTYRTFGKTELREEVKAFIDALDQYSQAVNDKVTLGPVYELMLGNDSTKVFAENQIKEMTLRVDRWARELRRLYEISTHISERIRAELVLYGDFFFQNHKKEELSEFHKNIFDLKITLRKSVSRIF